jgi:hypothetical protein
MQSHPTFQPLARFAAETRRAVRVVFTDIDDTLTTEGRLTARAYGSLEALQQTGILVVPITGRPAGWCDHIARMWPVDAVVGENGAFYFRYDRAARHMTRRFDQPDALRAANRGRLKQLADHILAAVPGAAVASDQAYRETDLAIDFCEDVPALPRGDVDRIVALFEAAGATAKISSPSCAPICRVSRKSRSGCCRCTKRTAIAPRSSRRFVNASKTAAMTPCRRSSSTVR